MPSSVRFSTLIDYWLVSVLTNMSIKKATQDKLSAREIENIKMTRDEKIDSLKFFKNVSEVVLARVVNTSIRKNSSTTKKD